MSEAIPVEVPKTSEVLPSKSQDAKSTNPKVGKRRHAATTLYPALDAALEAKAKALQKSRFDTIRQLIADALGMPAELPKAPKAEKPKREKKEKPAKPVKEKSDKKALPVTQKSGKSASKPKVTEPAEDDDDLSDLEDLSDEAPAKPAAPKTRVANNPEAINKARKENLAKTEGKKPAATK